MRLSAGNPAQRPRLGRRRRAAPWRGRAALALAAALAAAVVQTGCALFRPPRPVPRPPEVSPHELLRAHNAWAGSIEHVWARADLSLNFPTDRHGLKRARYNLPDHFFLQKPDGLFVHGQVLGQDVFQFGVGAERFWLWVRPEINTVWVGRRGGRGERAVLVSPPALLESLGVFPIEPSPDRAMDLSEYGGHAVLTEYSARGDLARRTWFSRATYRPERMDLYEDSGRRILTTEMLRYDRIGPTDLCTVYRVRFYGESEVDLVIHLKDVRLDKPINPKVFQYRRPPGATEEDLDRPPSGRAAGPPA